jgi:Tol biopolymer transport system component
VKLVLIVSLSISAVFSTYAAEKKTDTAEPVFTLKKSELPGLFVESPDGKSYLVNKDDEHGVWQVYVGKTGSTALTCITNTQQPNGPKPDRMKMQAHWHPNGRWIFVAVERDEYTTPPILGQNKDYVKGQLQCGLWTNMYAVSPDGKRWHKLTDFKSGKPGVPDGFTGPAITNDGTKAVWSQIVDGNVLAYWPFGKWELILADYDESNGIPRFVNMRNITPKGMHWNEPGNFHPDNASLLLTGSTEKDAEGMDQYILNIRTGQLTNLTESPTVWDEHGVFSPDGEKIIFMSAAPYRADPNASKVLSIKTEFMLMNKDGSGLVQLTHFKEPGHPESGTGIAACPFWSRDGKTVLLTTLIFPNYEYWELQFQNRPAASPAIPAAQPPIPAKAVPAPPEDPVTAAEKKYSAAVDQAKAELLVVLRAEMSRLTKAGDLDGAIKVRDKIRALEGN